MLYIFAKNHAISSFYKNFKKPELFNECFDKQSTILYVQSMFKHFDGGSSAKAHWTNSTEKLNIPLKSL